MIPEIGQFALISALAVALVLGVLPLAGAIRHDDRLMALARPAAVAQFGCVAVAYGCLLKAFISNDFSVEYVAQHSNSLLPMFYKVAAVWGGHEGSMLLWVLILALWTLAVALFSSRLPTTMVTTVLSVMGIISVGFLAFLLFTSNPFTRLLPPAPDGNDLNPLLQDPGMAFHPPLLYMGYVGFSVAFAFAIAALISGRLDAAWARWSRPWTTVAWIFLTLGIALGSYWAYYELGWGGWWFWDPVENASFMPWLVGTALIHSLAVTEKRGSFKNWTVLLAIMAFSLSLLGTFLVRSGVLTSVHAFATDPARGVFVLTFLALVVGCSLILFAWRAPTVGLGGSFELLSRESLLLVNNVLLTVAASAVLLGTLYPLFLDALNLGKISVGPPYFEAVFVPLMVPLVVLIGIGPFARWKTAHLSDLPKGLRWLFILLLPVAILLPFALGHGSALVSLGLLLGFWSIGASLLQLAHRLGKDNWRIRLGTLPRAYWGMIMAHIGIGVFVLGVTMVKGYESTADVRMAAGDTTTIGGYTFTFQHIEELNGPNYVAARAHVEVSRDGQKLKIMEPEKRIYNVQRMPMTEADIDAGLFRDLYVSLGEAIDAQTWVVRIQHKPLINWIWWGCLLMAFGGILAASDRRYRIARMQKLSPGTTSATATV
ncbi:heme lyase CcmF/NrfE family subunit [Denitratisoma oestradiolicum]|uniref:Heme lyase, CcmF subunit n=1 Tax=Denitratisoma oestradiolicum TaxID=311182 RepID=A0A6S6XUL0_9PROT|nr:heme lyase CcmF/NrfE family subunit [Denitratisoma oestradiolicum]TWO80609.1 c-type cytochrome biogenesis protein CcmF [Denitratisoma oestradiolicum]CAB1367687.1 heme lyase, CcmF subunit [Denitratisoma oestradiolicum]